MNIKISNDEEHMNNSTVRPRGGNRYEVTIGEEVRVIDLDGLTIISEADAEKLGELYDLADDLITVADGMSAENDKHWEAAAEHALNYSGFDVEEYIENHK